MYPSASFYPECKFLFIAENPPREEYQTRPLFKWGEDEIAAVRAALQKITRHRISNANDAEDIVQDTLMTMVCRNPGEELKKSLLVWCQGILRNKVGNYYRKTRRHANLKELHSGIQPEQLPVRDSPTPEISASQKELRSIIEAKLAEFPPEIRRVMDLLISGLSAGEIAKLLHPEPYQNVMNRLYRGRKRLARELIKCGFGPNSGNGSNRKSPGKNTARISRKVS